MLGIANAVFLILYDVAYMAGFKNNTADCLSRLPLTSAAEEIENEPEFVAMLSVDHLSAVSPSQFAAASASCPELCTLCAQIAAGWPLIHAAVSTVLHPYFRPCNELSV